MRFQCCRFSFHPSNYQLTTPLSRYLSELADYLRETKRNTFLLTAPPLRLPCAVGSPAQGIATV